jgi:hypothetical protein
MAPAAAIAITRSRHRLTSLGTEIKRASRQVAVEYRCNQDVKISNVERAT